MKEFQSRSRVALSEPHRVITAVCRHMTEHDATLEVSDGVHVLRFGETSAYLSQDGNAAVIDVRATDIESIYFARMAIAAHIIEFAEADAPIIAWEGDGVELIQPPNFQILEVRSIRDVTPCMRRLTLAGEGVSRFASLEALHLNILIQRPGLAEPQWPTVGADGLIKWADSENRPHLRKYTVRSVDLEAGTIDIDFVLHPDAGPGSDLVKHAGIGDRIGVAGPGGGGLAVADWYLFAGDETALPAIARMLEALPVAARGRAIIEVANAAEVQPLRHPAGIELVWVLRNGLPSGSTNLLTDVVAVTELPKGSVARYVWVGCEFEAFRSIRADLRNRSLKKHEHLVVSYWRRGNHDV